MRVILLTFFMLLASVVFAQTETTVPVFLLRPSTTAGELLYTPSGVGARPDWSTGLTWNGTNLQISGNNVYHTGNLNAWLVGGNALSAASVMGSTNNFDVIFRRNNTEFLRIYDKTVSINQAGVQDASLAVFTGTSGKAMSTRNDAIFNGYSAASGGTFLGGNFNRVEYRAGTYTNVNLAPLYNLAVFNVPNSYQNIHSYVTNYESGAALSSGDPNNFFIQFNNAAAIRSPAAGFFSYRHNSGAAVTDAGYGIKVVSENNQTANTPFLVGAQLETRNGQAWGLWVRTTTAAVGGTPVNISGETRSIFLNHSSVTGSTFNAITGLYHDLRATGGIATGKSFVSAVNNTVTAFTGLEISGDPANLSSSYAIRSTSNVHTYLIGSMSLGVDNRSLAKLLVQGDNTTSTTFAGRFRNSAGTDLMAIQNNGQVGIGTTTASATLDVNGSLEVATRTGTASTIAGWASDGKAVEVSIGTGLSLTGGTLSAPGSITWANDLTTSTNTSQTVRGFWNRPLAAQATTNGQFYVYNTGSSNFQLITAGHTFSGSASTSVHTLTLGNMGGFGGGSYALNTWWYNSSSTHISHSNSGNILIGSTTNHANSHKLQVNHAGGFGYAMLLTGSGSSTRMQLQNTSTGSSSTDGMFVQAIGTDFYITQQEASGGINFQLQNGTGTFIGSDGSVLIETLDDVGAGFMYVPQGGLGAMILSDATNNFEQTAFGSGTTRIGNYRYGSANTNTGFRAYKREYEYVYDASGVISGTQCEIHIELDATLPTSGTIANSFMIKVEGHAVQAAVEGANRTSIDVTMSCTWDNQTARALNPGRSAVGGYYENVRFYTSTTGKPVFALKIDDSCSDDLEGAAFIISTYFGINNKAYFAAPFVSRVVVNGGTNI